MVYVKKNTLIKNCGLLLPHFYGLPLDLCGKHITALFAKHAAIFANAIFANAPQLAKRTHFHGKSDAILGLRHFTRQRTFRNSVKVRRTQRDKRGARYAALISVAVARFLHSF